MTTKTELIKNQCKQLNLSALSTQFDASIAEAEKQQMSYLELVKTLLETEINHRMEKDKQRRTKQARLPLSYNLDLFDYDFQNGENNN
jgi:DNA replication protein DnaC